MVHVKHALGLAHAPWTAQPSIPAIAMLTRSFLTLRVTLCLFIGSRRVLIFRRYCAQCCAAFARRKAFSLLQYTISRDRTGAGSEACVAVPALCSVLGTAPAAAATGAGAGADADVEEGGVSSELRQAALGVLLELAKGATTWSAVQQVCRAGVGLVGDGLVGR